MPDEIPFRSVLYRDGTSQQTRRLPALDPASAPVDERSLEDLLAFAQGYARMLRYFNSDNEIDGDWLGFFAPELVSRARKYGKGEVEYVLAEARRRAKEFLANPERFEAIQSLPERRPHYVLFLVFLQLLQRSQARMNDYGRRHLEFHYRELLGLTPRTGSPHQVHIVAELADGERALVLPSGTRLAAGADSEGNDVVYRTDSALFATPVRVSLVKRLFADTSALRFEDVRRDPHLLEDWVPRGSEHPRDWISLNPASDRTFMALVEFALGEPGPGGVLPLYPESNGVPLFQMLKELDELVAFPGGLNLSIAAFRTLVELKHKVDPALPTAGAKWDEVNAILERAAQRRDPTFKLRVDDLRRGDFQTNHQRALGLTGSTFLGLPEVKDIFALYRHYGPGRGREDVEEFVAEGKLGRLEKDEFKEVMRMVVDDLQADWRDLYDILRAAARRSSSPINPVLPDLCGDDGGKFEKVLAAVTRNYTPKELDEAYEGMQRLEGYFHMPVEEYAHVREICRREFEATSWEWKQVEEILTRARDRKLGVLWRSAVGEVLERRGINEAVQFALSTRLEMDELDPATDEELIRRELGMVRETFERLQEFARKKPTPESRDQVCRILEAAQRQKEGMGNRRIEIERWENLCAAEGTPGVGSEPDRGGQAGGARWPAFGDRTHPPGRLGLAISSSLLRMAEGTRMVTLTLPLAEEGFDVDAIRSALTEGGRLPFCIFMSTAAEMWEVPQAQVQIRVDLEGKARTLVIIVRLGVEAPPIEAPGAGVGIGVDAPVLELRLADFENAGSDRRTKRFGPFRNLKWDPVGRIGIAVQVRGLTGLLLQNEYGTLNPDEPFEPFGMSPARGSTLRFAHPELCLKGLDELSFSIDWMGVPDDLKGYYTGYTHQDPKIEDNTSFTALLRLRSHRRWIEVGSFALFHASPDSGTDGQPNEKDKQVGASKTNEVTLQGTPLVREPDGALVMGEEVRQWNRYWEIELNAPAFGHAEYPAEAFQYAQLPDAEKGGKTSQKPPNIPYTPKIKKWEIGYRASVEFGAAQGDSGIGSLYHLEPFGHCPVADSEAPDRLFPRFEDSGSLFIGLENVSAPQLLSLLIQMAEGSADPSLGREPVRWEYLSGNQWRTLEGGALRSDGTQGLQHTGILSFQLPAAESGSRMPSGHYWIRARIARNPRSVCDVVALHTNAVTATFEDSTNSPKWMDRPLPANTISEPCESIFGLEAIHQPYSSFGGNAAEGDAAYYNRISERLRHRQRAVTCWDYERLILEEFPDIHRVKCLPAGSFEDPALASSVQVIVVPDIRGRLPFDPFEPKVPADRLEAIERFLERHIPPGVRIAVRNPRYLSIKVQLRVRFGDSGTPGYYRGVLDRELQAFLSPWAYDGSADIVFSGRISTNLIVDFIERRPYVDYLASVTLFTSPDGRDWERLAGADADVGVIRGGGPDVILVSARQHELMEIVEERFVAEHYTGINFMKIGLDFTVG